MLNPHSARLFLPARVVLMCVLTLMIFNAEIMAANFTPKNLSELLGAFEQASSNVQDDVIDLGGQTFELEAELELESDEGHGLILRDGILHRAENAEPFRLLNLHEGSYVDERATPVVIEAVEFRNGLHRADDFSVGTGGGGALLSQRHTLIKDSRFFNNTVLGFGSGGAIRHSHTLEISNVLFVNNSAKGDTEFQTAVGGAIGIDDGASLFATHSYFLGNAADEGGAIHASHGVAFLNITRSAFDGNKASQLGGAIWSSAGESEVRISNSSFIANQAPDGGAAIYTQSLFVDVSLVHLTLWGNISDEGTGGGIRAMLPRDGNNLILRNSIITNNIGGNCMTTAGESLAFQRSDYNLLDDESCGADGITLVQGVASVFSGKFDFYGGATPSLPIAKASQASDIVPREHCLQSDARDIPRLDNAMVPDNYCDAGAFEVVPIEYIDRDGDSIRNNVDNCEMDSNPLQSDIDDDGVGDACDNRDDRDTDSDTVLNFRDNCPAVANLLQLDVNDNGIGDACDHVRSNRVREPIIE